MKDSHLAKLQKVQTHKKLVKEDEKEKLDNQTDKM